MQIETNPQMSIAGIPQLFFFSFASLDSHHFFNNLLLMWRLRDCTYFPAFASLFLLFLVLLKQVFHKYINVCKVSKLPVVKSNTLISGILRRDSQSIFFLFYAGWNKKKCLIWNLAPFLKSLNFCTKNVKLFKVKWQLMDKKKWFSALVTTWHFFIDLI